MDKLEGVCWVFGENVDTDQILPGYAMAEAGSELGKFAMAGSPMPDFSSKMTKGGILVAGPNFGCGSSREQAPVALKLAGVSLVVAVSFARIFRRNAINIGLPVLVADLRGTVQNGDSISVNLETAEIFVHGSVVQGTPPSQNVLETLRAGGLIPRVRLELGVTTPGGAASS